MPLPADATLTLGQPHSGDLLHSKPKQAMLFRMSAETLEQLGDAQNLPKLHVEFGENPGLYINDTFYPMRADQENGPHELYLRMASASKPMAPLKMYANVIGKFTVDRQLGEKVEGSVRDRTLEAEKQRTERKAIYLDTPPDLKYPGAKGKPRKDAAAPRRPAAVSAASRPTVTVKVTKVASPLPGSASHGGGSSSDVASTRARLIHCLALKPRTTDAAITMCGGRDPTPQMKKELLTLLNAVAEPKLVAKNSDPDAPQWWQLRLESWIEVRPYSWPSLTSDERTAMSRQARAAYKNMKIPESDPVWDHARYRDVGPSDAGTGSSTRPAAGTSALAAEPKKGMMSKGTTKKAKTAEGVRKRLPDIVVARDESARPGKDQLSKGKARDRDADDGSGAGTPTSATRPPLRKPGSGFKATKASATPPASDPRGASPLPPPPKKAGPVDARERRRELPAPSGSAKPLPPIAPPVATQDQKTTLQFRKKVKDAGERTVEERREERQRERERLAAAEERARSKGQGSPVPVSALSFKRKKPPQDGNDSEYSEREVPLSGATKKRRLESEQQSAAEKSTPRRDLSLPKKPVMHEPAPLTAPRPKVKKEPSPLSIAFSPPPSAPRSSLPPRPSMPENPQPPSSASSSSASTKDDAPHRSSSSSKRRPPIYTSSSSSSSDEPRTRGRTGARAAGDDAAAKKRKSKHAARFKARVPLPADRAGLRGYYKTCFLVYIRLYQEQAQRRDRIERMLGDERGAGDAPSEDDADADGDVDMADLDPDVLVAFMAELQMVTDEMNKIRAAWARLGGSVDSSGELVDE
ncbi:hypothetical protein C2E23DRAFT_899194 [Lenzites betulinus]|nr:hypothetical protein C2E23DRAFT_899194 [Lenzites betulinus]